LNDDLRGEVERLGPKGRDALRRVLILDQPDRDAIALELLHYGDQAGYDWADIIDALTMYPDQRRRVVRPPLDGQPHPSGWFADRLQG
jgi:hypothetical protein